MHPENNSDNRQAATFLRDAQHNKMWVNDGLFSIWPE